MDITNIPKKFYKKLLANEVVKFYTKKSVISFILGLLIAAFIILSTILYITPSLLKQLNVTTQDIFFYHNGEWWYDASHEDVVELIIEIWSIAVSVSIACAIIGFSSFLNNRLVLTDRRIIFSANYLSKKTTVVSFENIKGMDLKIGLLGKIFHYGSITLYTNIFAGELKIKRIKSPQKLANDIKEIIEKQETETTYNNDKD